MPTKMVKSKIKDCNLNDKLLILKFRTTDKTLNRIVISASGKKAADQETETSSKKFPKLALF